MKKSTLVLGLCLLLTLGATGCDDDDLAGLINVPVDQQVAAATTGVLTGINSVTALAIALVPQIPAAEAANGPLGQVCTDETASVCGPGDLPLSAELCDVLSLNPFLNLTACTNSLVGEVLAGNPNPAASLNVSTGVVTLQMLVGGVALDGTITAIPSFGDTCFLVSYTITISDGGVVSSASGSLTQCLAGFPAGTLNVLINELNLSIVYFFDGSSLGQAQVFDLGTQNLIQVCDINLINNSVDCNDPITKG